MVYITTKGEEITTSITVDETIELFGHNSIVYQLFSEQGNKVLANEFFIGLMGVHDNNESSIIREESKLLLIREIIKNAISAKYFAISLAIRQIEDNAKPIFLDSLGISVPKSVIIVDRNIRTLDSIYQVFNRAITKKQYIFLTTLKDAFF
jgi:hypothetical protein